MWRYSSHQILFDRYVRASTQPSLEPSLEPSAVPSTSTQPSVASKGGKASGESSSAKAAKSSTAKSEKAPTAKSAKTAPSPPSPPTMMASSPEVEEDAALEPQDDMDDMAKLVAGLIGALFTEPDQAVGDTGSIRDTLGGALMMLLDLFKDYENDGGRRGLRAAAVTDAIASKDMKNLKAELTKVINELRA
jgi:hypothetical protein